MENFTIKNPLGRSKNSELKYVTDGLIFLDSSEVQIRSSSVTLRRMASHLSGKLLPVPSGLVFFIINLHFSYEFFNIFQSHVLPIITE